MSKNSVKPSRMYYGFGCLNWILGFIVSILVIVFGMKNYVNSLEQFVAPGDYEIAFNKKGNYTIYHEFISDSEDEISFTRNPIEDLSCEISRSDAYEEVPVYKAKKMWVYFTGNRAGHSIFEFYLISPGNYLFSSYYPEGDERNEKGNQAILTIGHQDSGLKKFFGLGLLILIVGFFSGCIVIYYINSERRKNKLDISPV
ncbi:hypothetical protein JXI42_06275 [bacterium]|nr:hypothetical protein [bacterium]